MCGSTTASWPRLLQPSKYEAQADSSFSSWRKNKAASGAQGDPALDKVSIDRLNSQMDSARPKDALYDAIGLMGKAFASPRRLELIDLLAQGSRSVEELARASGQSTANASQHLQALHASGVVNRERDGTRVNYSLAGPDVLRLWLQLRDASATRVAEVERAARNYLGDEVEAISRDELLKRLRRSDVVLVDVRPAEEFDAGHIDGALSI